MKWEQYNIMTQEHKEEWNYKFKDKLYYKPNYSVFIITALLMLSIGFLSLTQLFSINGILDTNMSFTEVYVLSLKIILVNILILFVYIIMDISSLIYYNIKNHYWLKQRGYK